MQKISFPQFGALHHKAYIPLRIDAVVRRIRDLCGLSGSEAFDPYVCAKRLGIEVRFRELPPDTSGRLRLDFRTPTIELRSGENERRHRFTLCHELAHLSFLCARPALSGEVEYFDCVDIDDREEQLCERIASTLLMPTSTFRNKARAFTPSYESLLAMSQAFDVSIHAALARIRELRIWSVGEMIWKLRDNGKLERYRSTVRIKGAIRGREERMRMETQTQRILIEAENLLRQDLLGSRILWHELSSSKYVCFRVADSFAFARQSSYNSHTNEFKEVRGFVVH